MATGGFLRYRYRCILIDLRGHGRSRGVSNATDADESDVLAVLDALGVGSFSAIGHSLGGVVLGGIAHTFPQRVRAAKSADLAEHRYTGLIYL